MQSQQICQGLTGTLGGAIASVAPMFPPPLIQTVYVCYRTTAVDDSLLAKAVLCLISIVKSNRGQGGGATNRV